MSAGARMPGGASAGAPSGRTRLFFALWPGQRVRASLSALARVSKADRGGRIMQPRNLHLTLAFLGDTVEAHRDAAVVAASRLKMSPFSLSIDRSGYFRQARDRCVFWVGCDAEPSLSALAASLHAALREAGVPFDRKPFVPHVTLLRDARASTAPLVFPPVLWTVRDFALIASTRDAHGPLYRIDAGPMGAAT